MQKFKMGNAAFAVLAMVWLNATEVSADSATTIIEVTGDNSGNNGPRIFLKGGRKPSELSPIGVSSGIIDITFTTPTSTPGGETRPVVDFVRTNSSNLPMMSTSTGYTGHIFDSRLGNVDGLTGEELFDKRNPAYLAAFHGITSGVNLDFSRLIDILPAGEEYRVLIQTMPGLPGDVTYDFRIDFYGVVATLTQLGPDAQQQLEETGAVMVQTGLGMMLITRTNTRDAVAASFASRDATPDIAMDGSVNQMMGATHVWMRASGFKSSGEGRSFSSPMLQVGADVEIGQNLLAGLSVGRANLRADATDFSFSGTQTSVQPYLGWRSDSWHGTAGISFGKLSYDNITHSGGTATAEGKLRAAYLEIGKDIALDAGKVISPTMNLTRGRIELDTTSGTLAGSGVGDSAEFTRFGLGAELRKSMAGGEVVFGLMAEHTDTDAAVALTSGTYDQTGWAGRASFGYIAELDNGISIDAGVSFGGLGQSMRETSAHFEIAKRF